MAVYRLAECLLHESGTHGWPLGCNALVALYGRHLHAVILILGPRHPHVLRLVVHLRRVIECFLHGGALRVGHHVGVAELGPTRIVKLVLLLGGHLQSCLP